jgi:hypothetical protein
MARIILFSALLFLVHGMFAQLADRPVNSTLSHVTVYLSGAQVTRSSSVELRQGSQRIVFKDLSAEADPASIQVKARDGLRILHVQHRLDHGNAPATTPEVNALHLRQVEIQHKVQEERIQIGILQNEEQRLLANEEINGGDRGVSLEQLRGINEYVKERITAIRMGQMQRQRHVDALQQEAQRIHLQLGQLQARSPKVTSQVVVEVDASRAVRSTLTLTYVVRSAGWSPQYDIRVASVDAPLSLLYKAAVHQSTGEDWTSVALELSSGDPQHEGVMPEMQVWRLDENSRPPGAKIRDRRPFDANVREVRGIIRDARSGEPLPFVNVLTTTADGTTLNGTTSGFDGYYALAVPPGGRKLSITMIGYSPVILDIQGGTMNISLEPQQLELREMEVVNYKAPLIDRDGASRTVIQREEIKNTPGRSVASVATTSAVQGISVRGSRSEGSYAYQDGTRVSQGGVPSNFGDGGSTEGTLVRQRPTHFAFTIAMPYSIPGDGQAHVVPIKEHVVSSTYRYYSIPRLDPGAYLFAKATGWDDLALLPGPANLFFEGTFIGESYLDSDQVGDTLDISLGRDKSLVVERTRSKDMSRQQFLGSRRVETVGWEIGVRNTKAQAVDLVIMDQYPVPARQEIEVNLLTNDASQVDPEKGFLTWRTTLAGKAAEKRHFVYSVKAPRTMRLVLE